MLVIMLMFLIGHAQILINQVDMLQLKIDHCGLLNLGVAVTA